jgi:hypothetical protein
MSRFQTLRSISTCGATTWANGTVPSNATHSIVYIPAGTHMVLDADVYIRFWAWAHTRPLFSST